MIQNWSFSDRIKAFISKKEIFNMLFIINIIVWLSIIVIKNIAFLFDPNHNNINQIAIIKWITDNFALSSNINTIILKPWTLITYMFLHFDFLHIFFNLLWFYWFGKIFTNYLSQKRLLITYLLGGVFGAIFFIAAYNIFPAFETQRISSYALGASASILAVVVAIAFYVPNFSVNLLFIGEVKIVYIAIITILLDFLTLSSSNTGGHIAHIGGAAWGFAYAKLFLNNGFRFFYNSFNKYKKKKNYNIDEMTDYEYNAFKAKQQKEIDAILDKLSRSGYESLSKMEKDKLFSSSKK